MTDQAAATSDTSTTAAPGADDATITLDTETPVVLDPAPAAKVEPTAEELAAEETRRGALTDDERKAEDDVKAAEAAAKVPEKYDPFKTPEGITLIPEVVAEFEGVAKELGLTQVQAQKIADIGAKLTQKWAGDQNQVVKNAQAEWEKQSRADKEFGGEKVKENIAVAEIGLKAFATPELRKLLKESGLNNHPEFIRTFFRIGQQIKADTTERGGNTDGVRDNSDAGRAARLYPPKAA